MSAKEGRETLILNQKSKELAKAFGIDEETIKERLTTLINESASRRGGRNDREGSKMVKCLGERDIHNIALDYVWDYLESAGFKVIAEARVKGVVESPEIRIALEGKKKSLVASIKAKTDRPWVKNQGIGDDEINKVKIMVDFQTGATTRNQKNTKAASGKKCIKKEDLLSPPGIYVMPQYRWIGVLLEEFRRRYPHLKLDSPGDLIGVDRFLGLDERNTPIFKSNSRKPDFVGCEMTTDAFLKFPEIHEVVPTLTRIIETLQ